MLGKYIDALPAVALKRIVVAKSWRLHDYSDSDGACCLLGHAEDWHWDEAASAPACRAPDMLRLREVAGDSWLNWPPLIGQRFDRLVERLSMEQAVSLLQQRAWTDYLRAAGSPARLERAPQRGIVFHNEDFHGA